MGNYPVIPRDHDHIVFYAREQCLSPWTSFAQDDAEDHRLLHCVEALNLADVAPVLTNVAQIQTCLNLQILSSLLICVGLGTALQIATTQHGTFISICMIITLIGSLGAGRSMCGNLKPKVAATVASGWKIPPEAVDYMWWKPPGKITAERVAHLAVDLRVVSQRTIHPNTAVAHEGGGI